MGSGFLIFLVEEGLKWFKDMSYKGLSQDADNLVSIYGIACNVSIANYVEHEHAKEALKWFISMYRGMH